MKITITETEITEQELAELFPDEPEPDEPEQSVAWNGKRYAVGFFSPYEKEEYFNLLNKAMRILKEKGE